MRKYAAMIFMAGLAAASWSVPAQQLNNVSPQAVPERLCTAGSNPVYGWYEHGLGFLGVLTPGNTACTKLSVLKLEMGGLQLPLADEVVYDLPVTPPHLRSVTVPLLEPALCENYYPYTDGTDQWMLVIEDANGDPMISPVKGVQQLNYAAGSGALSPQLADTSAAWLRCHSGLSTNADLTEPVANPDGLFADGFEAAVNLQIEFLHETNGNRLVGDVIEQSSVPGSTVTYKVRVSNRGNVRAHDVRVREFAPTNSDTLSPIVSLIACIDHGANGNGADPCSSGASNPLHLNIGDLDPNAERSFTLTRGSSSSDSSSGQAMALVQVAAFSDPSLDEERDFADNSRALRIRVVDQITVSGSTEVNGQPGAVGGAISIDAAVAQQLGCTVTGQAATCPPSTSGLVFHANVAAGVGGLTFTGFSGCIGTESGVTDTTGTFTTTGGVSCDVVANFHSMPTVTASVSGNNPGTVSPQTQLVHYNKAASLTINPGVGYTVDTTATTGCGGVTQISGTSWQTAPVTGDCAVSVKFKAITSTVTVNAGPHGTVTSTNPLVVTYPMQKAVFTALPDQTYQAVIAGTSTCQTSGPVPNPFGAGVMFQAENVLGDCTIDLEFDLILHAVTVAPSVNGSITVADGGQVPHGQSASFTLDPDTGYHVSSVTGTPACGAINVSGNTGTTGAITSAGCELTATFAINEYTVTVSLADTSGTHGTIGAQGATSGASTPVVISPVSHGDSAEVWTFPEAGYHAVFPVNPSCQFAYSGMSNGGATMKYKATSVTADCSLSIQFLPD